MDAYWAAPPISRTITACTVIASVLARAGMVNPMNLVFFWPYLSKSFPPQIWRLETCFWLTGPKLQLIFDPYFLFIYGSQLELESPRFRTTGDFLVYLLFNKISILALAGGYLRGMSFLQPLMASFAYTYAQDNPTRRVSMFIITFEAKYLPIASLFIGFIVAGPQAAMEQATGIISAHAYDFLTRIWPTFGGGMNLLPTPAFITRLFNPRSNDVSGRPHGTTYAPGGRPSGNTPGSTAASTGSSWGSTFGTWGRRGQGRRLGGD